MDINDEIQLEAYYLYERSGKIEGRDLENWYEAERIVQERRSTENDEPESETRTGKRNRKQG